MCSLSEDMSGISLQSLLQKVIRHIYSKDSVSVLSLLAFNFVVFVDIVLTKVIAED